MAMKALVLDQTIDFVSKRDDAHSMKWVDIDPEDPSKGQIEKMTILEGATVFKLKPLDVFLMGHIYDSASILSGKQGEADIDIKTRVNATNIDAVRFGLAGFVNFQDKDGNEVSFAHEKTKVNGREYTCAKDSVLRMLGIQLVEELASRIKEISEVSSDKEKN